MPPPVRLAHGLRDEAAMQYERVPTSGDDRPRLGTRLKRASENQTGEHLTTDRARHSER